MHRFWLKCWSVGRENDMAVRLDSPDAFIMVYTRMVEENTYPSGLAGSLHLAVSRDGRTYRALNRNYGVLFVRGMVRADNTICPLRAETPRVLRLKNGKYLIAAKMTGENGEPVPEGAPGWAFWETADWVRFHEISMEPGISILSGMTEREKRSLLSAANHLHAADIAVIRVRSCEADFAERYWNPLHSVAVRIPDKIRAEELPFTQATVIYSDGSTDRKPVDWHTERIPHKPGEYSVGGTIIQRHYPFPLAKGYGDPVLFFWEGHWYVISTNDNLDDVGLYIRKADSPAALFAPETREHLILGLDEARGFLQSFWAPEFHVIGGQPYLLFAVSGTPWKVNCYLMRLKKHGCPADPNGWEEPVPAVLRDGRLLAWKEGAISLDMTYIEDGGRAYLVWSYREHMGTPQDTGSMLYIAETDSEHPWRLISDPVLLSRPIYGWENVNGTINNEGPNAFVHDSRIYLCYSGGDAIGYTYAVGLLSIPCGENLLDASKWEKRCTPVMNFTTIPGEYGPGHNSFFVDEDGHLMTAYHAEDSYEHHLRCDGIRRVHFDIHGEPVFNMDDAHDLSSALREVHATVLVTTGETGEKENSNHSKAQPTV